MPQPTTTPAAPTAPDSTPEPVLHAALLTKLAKLVEDEKPLTSAQKQIVRALRLENERAENLKKIGANREYLRLMDENEELDDEEAAWMDDFYPSKEKGQARSEDEIERTRKAKAAARS